MTTTTSHWTFLSNHSHVLVCIAREPDVRVRDIAKHVGITQRGVQRIIAELEGAGYLSHERIGRRNVYHIDLERELRHELELGVSLRQLLTGIVDASLLADDKPVHPKDS